MNKFIFCITALFLCGFDYHEEDNDHDYVVEKREPLVSKEFNIEGAFDILGHIKDFILKIVDDFLEEDKNDNLQ